MVSFVKIIFEDGRYRYAESNDEELGNLGFFLATDIGCYWPGYQKWAFDDTQDETVGNIAHLYKEDGFIFVGDAYSEEPDGGPYLKVSIEEFVNILDQWEEFCKTRPKEILITKDGEKIIMKGLGKY